ncbi:two-component regulator propeller domain-containing protein [Limibacter armeniacum]|uniref:ligand-binding sensor domain-containing protein n=1 Tax=Limibacter armeniacum TaxID=466084 RepID=UPI002FE58DF3
MKKTGHSQLISVFYLMLLIVFVGSCTNQNTSINKPTEVSITSNESETDSVLRLEFHSMIRSVFEDSKGNFWFGSDKEGVCRYDGKSFTYFSTKDGLCDNQIRTIQEDQHGHIWFATGNGISSYDGKKFTTHTSKPYAINTLTASSIWKKEANDLWFNGELEGGIYRYDGEHLNLLKFPVVDPKGESFSIAGTVTGISQGKNNMLWIANYRGVIGFDGKSFAFISERGIEYHVRGILEDSKGNLWIGNNGIGVLFYDGKTTVKLSDKITPKPTSSNNFPYHVFTVAEDHQGNIWFGDRDSGAWCYNGQTLTNYTTSDGLTNMFVRVIYKDKKNDLWFGLADGSVCKFNGKSFDKMF